MSFTDPFWFILLLPAAVLMYYRPLPGKLLNWLRGILLFVLILLMTRPALYLGDIQGTVVAIVDRSASMPDDSAREIVQNIGIMQDNMPAGNSLAVISVGGKAVIDKPASMPVFQDFVARVNPDSSNLYDGIVTAASLIEQGATGRIVVFSDGKWTGSAPYTAAAPLAAR
ncbi:MAG: VWA domain-containing protein, partial [Sedimentisphaerales bacterium]|nr:VWA domain-containing protein [Sedimentisphaerales bacterium]